MHVGWIGLILGFGLGARAQVSPGLMYFKSSNSSGFVNQALPAARRLLLQVDAGCFQESWVRYPFQIRHKISGGIRYRTVAVDLVGKTEVSDYQNLSELPCIFGVAEDAETQIAAADPLEGEQGFHFMLQQDPAEKLFFHPLFGIRTSVKAGVIDTGVELDHPDLQERMWKSLSGEVGYDFFNDDPDPSDDAGHGTHVAGLIGAVGNNGEGGRGVFAGFGLRIMPLKTQGLDGAGSVGDLVNAIYWAVEHGADILNMSLVSRSDNPALIDAIDYALAKNVILVVAAGNHGEQITAANFMAPVSYAPTRLGMVSVGSIDLGSFRLSGFSNHGMDFVEIAAPGSNGNQGIISTFPPQTYLDISGTSMSAPQVTGALALARGFVRSNGLSDSAAQLEADLLASGASMDSLNGYIKNRKALHLYRFAQYLMHSRLMATTGGFDDGE